VPFPTFAIRKHASALFPLSSYVENGIMKEAEATYIAEAVHAKRNFLIVRWQRKTTLAPQGGPLC